MSDVLAGATFEDLHPVVDTEAGEVNCIVETSAMAGGCYSVDRERGVEDEVMTINKTLHHFFFTIAGA